MIKKTLIFLMTGVLFSSSNAQTRIDQPLPVLSEQKRVLTKSTGWMLNPEGQWISRDNRIPVFIENKYKTLIDYEKRSLGVDNQVCI